MAFDIEQLFGAIDIIVEQRLQDVNFDKTIICTIVDDSDKANGCYIVSDGTIRFKAYVSDSTYKNDDQVRVSVLNGDFSEKKFITGRYTGDENSSPITYKSPLESVIPITGNLVTRTNNHNNGVNGIRANDTVIEKVLWQVDLTSNTSFRDLQSNGIYNTLTLKADFKTLLSHYDLVSGNYGLRLDLFIQPTFNSTERIRKYITLDSSEMMGNPYSFSVYSTQAKKVDIVSTGVIAEMVLWLYQSVNGDGEGRQFIDRNGNLIPVNRVADDILVKNIEIGFGSDIVKVEDNTLELFTSSPPYYVYENPTSETNNKELELLWFNKTENNQYVGFSDGLFDLNYDEIEYLKLSSKDTRLMAQMGRTDIPNDESGLKLAADLKDAKPIMIKARDALTKDVADVLYKLQRQVKSVKSINDKLNNLLDTATGDLVTQWEAADQALENLNKMYVGVLQYAYDRQNDVTEKSGWDDTWTVANDYHKAFINAINLGVKKVNDFFDWFDGLTQPSAAQSAHRGNFDLYDYRMDQQLAVIANYVAQLKDIFDFDENDACRNQNKLIAYRNVNYPYVTYQAQDLSVYDNKYCIYWYRYERGYKLEYQEGQNNDEFNYGKFVTDGWRRLEITDASGNPILNLGVPREESETNPGYYPAKALLQILSREMNREFTEEKYMAVLFHNHEMFKSNIITFTNSEPELIPNSALLDQKDALKISHDVASMEHYQLYNEFNLLRSLEDGSKIRQLKCSYDGVFKKDEALINAGLYWYVPNHSTMLTFDKDDLIKEGFATDADAQTDKSIPGYTYFYKKVNVCAEEDQLTDENGSKYNTCNNADRYFFYKIKPHLEKDAQNNTILVKAYLEGVDNPVEGEITMTFSAFGTNGTKYTLSIVPSGSQVSVGGQDKPLDLAVYLKDSQNNVIDIVDSDDISEEFAYGFAVESWKGLPNAFVTTPVYDEDGKRIKGLTVRLTNDIQNWDSETPYFGIINAKVNFRVQQEENEDNAQVEGYQKYRVVDLNTLYAITYSSSDAYYMNGATHIVYNNQGTVSYVSEDGYELYRVNDKGNTPVPNQNWHIMYYDKRGNWITEDSDEWPMLLNYMPVLNSERRLTPAPLYIENLDYVPVVVCTVKEETTGLHDIAWVQPIIVTQNRYASPTMNDWNGSFTVNEANGTILSTAIGAGKKETDNSFSGILMGDIAKGFEFDPDNMSGLGLYGFNQGAQSFCLNVDGTAFFGKAGRGRIYFDGTSGTISSASYQQNRLIDDDGTYLTKSAAAGMMIDLDDGYIHMLGTGYDAETGKYQPDITTIENGGTAQAEILLTVGENDDYEITDAEGNKKTIDNTAYLKIRSAKQYDPNHYLIYVGSEQYYLQTDNYKPWEYYYQEGQHQLDFNGAGLKLDLQDGSLDAYNFKLSSKNVFINSTDESSAFFVIKDNAGSNLFYAGPSDYYLKSNDYKTGEKGIKLTLQGGENKKTGIEAYNFDLRAGNAGDDYEIILSDSGEPYLQVNTEVDDAAKALIKISKTEQLLQSSDYSSGSSGIILDLKNKKLEAYSGFKLKAYKETSNFIEINASTTGTHPLNISDNFKVSWNGSLVATGASVSGTINASEGSFNGTITATDGEIGGWTITADGLSNGNIQILSSGTISGVNISSSSINSDGDPFYVDTSGNLTASSGTIGGWTVGPSGFSNGSGWSMGPGTGLDFGDGFTVDENGILHAAGAEIEGKITSQEGEIGGWTINEDSISAGGLILSSDGTIDMGSGDNSLTLSSAGFSHNGKAAVTDAVIAWTGWTQGLFTKLSFVNGILVSSTKGDNAEGVDGAAPMQYNASSKGFKMGGTKTWGSLVAGPGGSALPQDVSSSGQFTIYCSLAAPVNLYTKNSTQGEKKYTPIGSSITTTSRYFYYYNGEIKNSTYDPGNYVKSGPWRTIGWDYTPYTAGSEQTFKYDTYSLYCEKDTTVAGEILVTLTD